MFRTFPFSISLHKLAGQHHIRFQKACNKTKGLQSEAPKTFRMICWKIAAKTVRHIFSF